MWKRLGQLFLRIPTPPTTVILLLIGYDCGFFLAWALFSR